MPRPLPHSLTPTIHHTCIHCSSTRRLLRRYYLRFVGPDWTCRSLVRATLLQSHEIGPPSRRKGTRARTNAKRTRQTLMTIATDFLIPHFRLAYRISFHSFSFCSCCCTQISTQAESIWLHLDLIQRLVSSNSTLFPQVCICTDVFVSIRGGLWYSVGSNPQL